MNDMNSEDLSQLNRRFDELIEAHKVIIGRLNNQDSDNKEYRVEREKIDNERAEAQYKLAQFLKNENASIRNDLTVVRDKVDPLYEIFVDMNGFNKVLVASLKYLGLLGVGFGVVYGFIRWIRG
jgi:hypothetical protein